MIEYIKGLMMCKRNDRIQYPDDCYLTSVFKFRDKSINISNLSKRDVSPYIGCDFDRESAAMVRDWLSECLNDSRCDKCWDYKLPSNFNGKITCSSFGNIISND